MNNKKEVKELQIFKKMLVLAILKQKKEDLLFNKYYNTTKIVNNIK